MGKRWGAAAVFLGAAAALAWFASRAHGLQEIVLFAASVPSAFLGGRFLSRR
ncbi:hypothetical protein AB0M46_08895 [Dactylosporangium sp. NPDC051485]|uniref:hypothetical protein n=1 Tax=Dactylosporangium sp. NPDC051485 TaxID=3154846 RepID=UPI00343ED0CB